MGPASATTTAQSPQEPVRESIGIGNRLRGWARHAVAGPLVFADVTRRVVAGRGVVDEVLRYISTPTDGDVPASVSLERPRVVAARELIVDPAGESISVVIDEIKRSRDPVIPLLETANVRGRVIPGQRQAPLPGSPETMITLSDPVIYFTFTSAIPAKENLEDFSKFILSQRTLLPQIQ